MEQRYRWLAVSPLRKAHIAKLASVFQAKEYNREAKSGFALSTVRGDLIEGTFIERIEFTEKILDPLGSEIVIQRIEFRHTAFRVSVAFPQLELANPPRSIAPFRHVVAGALDFEIAMSEIVAPPLRWAKALANANATVEIRAFRSDRFSLSNEIQASVSVTGTCDVRNAMASLVGKRVIEADSVICSWKSETGDWRVELRAGGTARVIQSPADQPAVVLRKALASFEA